MLDYIIIMGCKQSKKRCKICQTLNKNKKEFICEECKFIPTYITKYGRENLKRIINLSFQDFEKPVDLINDDDKINRRKSFKRLKSRTTLTLQRPWPTAPMEERPISPKTCNDPSCGCQDRISRPGPPAYLY